MPQLTKGSQCKFRPRNRLSTRAGDSQRSSCIVWITFRVVHGFPTSLTWYSASSSISHSSVSLTFMYTQRISVSLGIVESLHGICTLLTFLAMSSRYPRSLTQFTGNFGFALNSILDPTVPQDSQRCSASALHLES